MFKNPFNEFIKAIKSKNRSDVERKFKLEFLNKQDSDGYYPIHLVCINNAVDIFEYFLKQNCDIELLDSHKNRPIYHAVKNGSVEIVKLLLGYRCSFDNGNELLELAKTIPKERENITEIIEKAIENRQIGIEMDLKCSFDCDHKFCLNSFMMIAFDKSDVIACGNFGRVLKVVESNGSRVFAVKKVSWKQVELNSLSLINNESKYLENNINDYKSILSHPNIIKYFGAIKENNKLFIFMEYAENGSIHNLIENKYQDGLPYDLIIKYSKHILLALEYLHNLTILHRDVKCANILLDKDDNCRLTDLGCSRLLETIHIHKTNKNKKYENEKDKKTTRQANTFCGTSSFMAPEIILEGPYSFPCDLYSLGGTVIEMLTGKPPFYGTSPNGKIFKIGQNVKYDYEKLRPTPEELKIFIDQLLRFEPEERKTAADLLKLNIFRTVLK